MILLILSQIELAVVCKYSGLTPFWLDRQVLWPEHELHEVNQTVLRVVGDAHWVAQLVPWPDHDVPWVVDAVLWVR